MQIAEEKETKEGENQKLGRKNNFAYQSDLGGTWEEPSEWLQYHKQFVFFLNIKL